MMAFIFVAFMCPTHRPVGFTTMSKEVEASVVMTFLNHLFTLFDRICEEQGVHKLETAGWA